MVRIYTIGTNRKSAETFFEILRENNVRFLLDIRLKNSSQLAGFAKGGDLRYFTEKILGIRYRHDVRFAPDDGLFDRRKGIKLDMVSFADEFRRILDERNIKGVLHDDYSGVIDGICLLCSEEDFRECHRSVAAEYAAEFFGNAEVIHL